MITKILRNIGNTVVNTAITFDISTVFACVYVWEKKGKIELLKG